MARDRGRIEADVAAGIARPSSWPPDILALTGIAAQAWLITALWVALDLGGKLDRAAPSEMDIWLLAISGLLFVILAILPVVAIWGGLLAAITSLLVGNLALRRLAWPYRWAVSGLAATLIFVAVQHSTIESGIPRSSARPRQEPRAAAVPGRDGLPSAEVIAARARELAARCVDPTDPNIVAYCEQRREMFRLMNET